ncbi:MAG: hypothetical protein LGR52_11545 [Candidatus Thiosymbion ectosymbiont of Robbea hypermnestra]|nr:hypothetical protein [Candidatus Thiosymbion ectosymbiont of Robbea hypermnestra]
MNNQVQEELKDIHLALKGVSGLLAQDAGDADSQASVDGIQIASLLNAIADKCSCVLERMTENPY